MEEGDASGLLTRALIRLKLSKFLCCIALLIPEETAVH